MDLSEYTQKPARFIVGLMSGTSCDGIDAVLVRVKGTGAGMAMKLIAYENYPYDDALRMRLLDPHMGVRQACELNFELGERLADAAEAILDLGRRAEVEADFIASHGHTVAHYPPPDHGRFGTLQIGEAAVIAERTGLLVVSDFRPRDMAAGGQGAPLVPYADWHLWRNRKEPKTVACLNIGGIANFTVVTPEFDQVIAFDTGPGNMAIDGAVRLLTRGEKNLDQDGQAAARGVIIDEFEEYLLDHEFFSKPPPKSTGREEFGEEVYLRDALASRRNDYAFEDLIATVTAAVARSIVAAYDQFIRPNYEVAHLIVGGGGVKNKTLMNQIRSGLEGVAVFTTEQFNIPTGAREAIAFAILGNETVCGTPNNVPRATGASRPVILGKLTPP